uniref:Uncharacterized protein n=1 Tax=Zea mays TaxID=4577 RepID=B4FQU3_MAIZE|nr:unknown [Zea mays]
MHGWWWWWWLLAGSVDPGALLQLQRVHGGPGAPHLPRQRRRTPVRLRGGLRRRRRGPHQQLEVLLLLAAEPREAHLAQAPFQRPLLPRGHQELRRRNRRVGRPGRGYAAGRAELPPWHGVHYGPAVRGLPGPRAQGGAEAARQGDVGGAAPVAQPLRAGVPHRRLRPRRLPWRAGGPHRRRRRPRPHLPHEQAQVGPEELGGDPGRGGVLPGGVPAVGAAGRAGEPGGAGAAEPADPRLLRGRGYRRQAVPAGPQGAARVGGALRRREVGPVREAQGRVRPAGHPGGGAGHLQAARLAGARGRLVT